MPARWPRDSIVKLGEHNGVRYRVDYGVIERWSTICAEWRTGSSCDFTETRTWADQRAVELGYWVTPYTPLPLDRIVDLGQANGGSLHYRFHCGALNFRSFDGSWMNNYNSGEEFWRNIRIAVEKAGFTLPCFDTSKPQIDWVTQPAPKRVDQTAEHLMLKEVLKAVSAELDKAAPDVLQLRTLVTTALEGS